MALSTREAGSKTLVMALEFLLPPMAIDTRENGTAISGKAKGLNSGTMAQNLKVNFLRARRTEMGASSGQMAATTSAISRTTCSTDKGSTTLLTYRKLTMENSLRDR